MLPIVCVGETLAEREAGRTLEVVRAQVDGGLAGFAAERGARSFVLAYEPVWAIGTGQDGDHARRRRRSTRTSASCWRGCAARPTAGAGAHPVRRLVKADNAAELLGQPDIDGALVGGASLKAGDFAAIVKAQA